MIIAFRVSKPSIGHHVGPSDSSTAHRFAIRFLSRESDSISHKVGPSADRSPRPSMDSLLLQADVATPMALLYLDLYN